MGDGVDNSRWIEESVILTGTDKETLLAHFFGDFGEECKEFCNAFFAGEGHKVFDRTVDMHLSIGIDPDAIARDRVDGKRTELFAEECRDPHLDCYTRFLRWKVKLVDGNEKRGSSPRINDTI